MMSTGGTSAVWKNVHLVVAVGLGGRRLFSTDAITWPNDYRDEPATDGTSMSNLLDAHYAKKVLVAVGGGCNASGCRGRILTFDGLLWRDHSVPVGSGRLNAVEHGAGKWIALSEDGVVLSSVDAVSWSKAGTTMRGLRDVAYGTVAGRPVFIAVGRDQARAISSDGVSWTGAEPAGVGNPTLNAVVIASDVVVAAGDGGRRLRSANGSTWSHLAAGGSNIHSAVFADGKFYAYTIDGLAHVSEDGAQSWTTVTVFNGVDGTVTVGQTSAGSSSRLFVGASLPAIRKTSDNGLGFTTRATGGSARFENLITRIVFAGQ
jgi:hypothetical protein